MVKLVDEADFAAADRGAFIVAQAVTGTPVDGDFATVRMLQQAGDMQQCRLAGAGGGDKRDDFAFRYRKIRALQDREQRIALPVMALDAGKLENDVALHEGGIPYS